MSRELKEKSIRWLLTGVAFVSLLSLACIMLFLFMEGLPLFADYPLWDFLTGHLWYPTSEPPEFGIFPLIMGSLAVTILASCIAVPLGIMTAAYLAEIAASRTRRIVKPFVELLAALPSVVIGFFGMVIVAPFLQDWFGADTGLNLLNAALMLAFMSVPTICSVAEDALFAVPRTLREASLALGLRGWQYESAFARSRGGLPELPTATVSRCFRAAPAGTSATLSNYCFMLCKISSTVVPYNFASAIKLEVLGSHSPLSHLDTACRLTPIVSATNSWVILFLVRKSFNTSPKFCLRTLFSALTSLDLIYFFKARIIKITR